MTIEWSQRLASACSYARAIAFAWDYDAYLRWLDRSRSFETFESASTDVRTVVTAAESAGPPDSWPTVLPYGVQETLDAASLWTASSPADPSRDRVSEALSEAVSALAKATAALAERDAPSRTVKRETEFKVDDRGVIVGKEETETWQ
ncbi:MAG: hypothetical protein ACOYB2_10455 [Limnohabitans sp.]